MRKRDSLDNGLMLRADRLRTDEYGCEPRLVALTAKRTAMVRAATPGWATTDWMAETATRAEKAATKRSEKRLKRWSWTGRNSVDRAVTRAGRALTCNGGVQLGGRGDCRGAHNTTKHNQSFANNPLATTLRSIIAIGPFLMSLYLCSISARFFDVFLRFSSAVVATSEPGSLLYAST